MDRSKPAMALSFPFKIALLVFAFTTLGVLGAALIGFHDADVLLRAEAYRGVSRYLDQESAEFVGALDLLRKDAIVLAEADAVRAFSREERRGGAGKSDVQDQRRARITRLFAAVLEGSPALVGIRLHGGEAGIPGWIGVERGEDGGIRSLAAGALSPLGEEETPFQGRGATSGETWLSRLGFSAGFDASAGRGVVSFKVYSPVVGRDGGVLAVVAIEADLRKLAAPLISVSQDGYLALADVEGHLLAHPGMEVFPEKGLGELARGLAGFERGGRATGEPLVPFPNADSVMLSGELPIDPGLAQSGIVTRLLQVREGEGAMAPLVAMAVVSRDRVTDNSWLLIRQMLAKTLLFPVVLFFLIIFASRRLTRPVRVLTQAANRVAAGDLGVELPEVGRDEIGELTRAFAGMVAHLVDSQERLRELAASLEVQVQERTRDLAVARDEALAASQAKSLFLASMSHEIRTPLNVVLGMLEILHNGELKPAEREYVHLAHGSGKILLSVINDILDFSKVEAGRLTLERIPFDLRELVDETARILSPLAHDKKIELTAFVPSSLPSSVVGDPGRLRQILVNLLGNAIKFTPVGGTVELYGGPVVRGDGWVEYLFEIRDTGIGVPPEKREEIFLQFTQADSSTTRRFGGTGLGLAISRRLVGLMGGELGVDDNRASATGSVFHFSVVLEQGDPGGVCPIGDPYARLEVLVLDSDGLLRVVLEDALTLRGARCVHAADAVSARRILVGALAEKRPYHLVVLNQRPGGDLRRDLSRLQEGDLGPRFIILTDLLDQIWDQVSDFTGAYICLKKPINAERLLAAIAWLFEGTSVVAEIGATTGESGGRSRRAGAVRILIVDDQAANLKVARSMLVSLGIAEGGIDTAIDGRQAVRLFQDRPYDLIFMDCQMPDMDGFETTRRIRAIEAGNGMVATPILALSADASAMGAERGREAGMNGFLVKPITLSELGLCLRDHLQMAPMLPVSGRGGPGFPGGGVPVTRQAVQAAM
ncbi:MAG: response regulator, partial [Magnetococcales bacterium]|nr:response regulator [Magnetococcales bacterium]